MNSPIKIREFHYFFKFADLHHSGKVNGHGGSDARISGNFAYFILAPRFLIKTVSRL